MTRLRGITGIATCLIAGWTAPASADAVTEWNALALGLHHPAGSDRPAGPGAGAGRSARRRPGDRGEVRAVSRDAGGHWNESIGAAAAAAAYTVLSDSRICPDSAQPTLDTAFAPYLAGNDAGLAVGYAAGNKLLTAVSPGRHAHVRRQERNRPMAPDATRKRVDGVPLAQGRRALRDDEGVSVSAGPAAADGQPPVPARVQRGQGEGVDREPS